MSTGKRDPISFLVTWNPDKFAFEDYEIVIDGCASGSIVQRKWSTGSRADVQIGDRAFFLRQEKHRGILGVGRVAGNLYHAEHWDSLKQKNIRYVIIQWHYFFHHSNRIPFEELINCFPQVNWRNIQAGGVKIPENVADELERVLVAKSQGIH